MMGLTKGRRRPKGSCAAFQRELFAYEGEYAMIGAHSGNSSEPQKAIIEAEGDCKIMFSRRVIAAFSLILAFAFGAACGKEETATSAGPLWKPSGNEGNITGVINFTGAVPAPSKLDMSSDSKCEGENFLNDVVVKGGKLQNVFIFVKSGLPEASFETPADAVTLDQNGCKYVPRVLGVQAGQPLKIVNSDQTNH